MIMPIIIYFTHFITYRFNFSYFSEATDRLSTRIYLLQRKMMSFLIIFDKAILNFFKIRYTWKCYLINFKLCSLESQTDRFVWFLIFLLMNSQKLEVDEEHTLIISFRKCLWSVETFLDNILQFTKPFIEVLEESSLYHRWQKIKCWGNR